MKGLVRTGPNDNLTELLRTWKIKKVDYLKFLNEEYERSYRLSLAANSKEALEYSKLIKTEHEKLMKEMPVKTEDELEIKSIMDFMNMFADRWKDDPEITQLTKSILETLNDYKKELSKEIN